MFRQLLPGPGELPDAAAVVEDLTLGDLAREDRPYLVLNMVTTADGRATIRGRSGPIGNAADQDLFHALRTRVDAVMVGAGTLRAERYGRLVRKPERRAARLHAGLAPDPLAVIVSGRLDLPEDLPLLHEPEQEVLVATFSDGELEGAASIEYLRADEGPVDVSRLLAELRARGIRSVLCEGGPTLNAELLRVGGVDEIFLCLAPKLAGEPDAPTMVSGVLLETTELELVWLLENESHLFARYRLRR
ncbi:MAG TPA: dihydrofolate reductase family protein [Thermoleophilaceae bacterium]|nr:dihydrofolate reductase family protein [Thermoleophilaceae bacterium]